MAANKKQQLDQWVGEDGKPSPRPSNRCWQGLFPGFGCEQLYEFKDFNRAANLCIRCSSRIAQQWNLAFEDLPFLFTAISVIQGTSWPPPRQASREDILTALRTMGLRDRPGQTMQWTPQGSSLTELSEKIGNIADRMATSWPTGVVRRPPESQLPTADRSVA